MSDASATDSAPALPALRPRLRDRILELLRPSGVTGMYWLSRFSALRTDGWLRSVRVRRSVDAAGRPIPWMTYPAIDFLAARLRRDAVVFEWGSGASTRWFASRTAAVDACEHDADWHAQVAASLPGNCSLRLRPLADGERYQQAIAETGRTYDLVIIDGRRRNACAERCLAHLAPDGAIVWDNTDRPEYAAGLTMLREAGFHRVDFLGMAPMLVQKSCTSVLFRARNRLGI